MDGGAHFFGKTDEEANVVDGEEGGAEGFAALQKVMEVGTSVVLAGVAVAICFDGCKIVGEPGVFEIDAFFFGVTLGSLADAPDEGVAVTSESSGGDAVKDIYAASHTFDEVDWFADAHEVAEFVGREVGCGIVDGFVHVGLTFVVVGDATDGVAVEVESGGLFG